MKTMYKKIAEAIKDVSKLTYPTFKGDRACEHIANKIAVIFEEEDKKVAFKEINTGRIVMKGNFNRTQFLKTAGCK